MCGESVRSEGMGSVGHSRNKIYLVDEKEKVRMVRCVLQKGIMYRAYALAVCNGCMHWTYAMAICIGLMHLIYA